MSAPPDELPGRTRRRVPPWRLVSSLVGVAAVAVGLLPDLLGLDRHGPFVQLVAFRPPLLAGTALLTVAAIVAAGVRRRGWTLAAGLLAVTVVGGVMVVPRALPDSVATPVTGRTVTVLSFNTYEGQADVDALAALVRTVRPDLIALPESGGRFATRLAPLLPDYRFAPSGTSGRDVNGVTAGVRNDLGDVSMKVDRSTNFPSVTLTGGALGDVRFVAFHSVAPTPGEVSDWSDDLATLGRWCANREAGAVIIAGDFNATLDHSVFRQAMLGCSDAAATTGRGLTGTWPTRLPRWLGTQIDHVLLTGGVTAIDTEVHDVPGSDHRAVVSRLRLP